MDSNAFETVTVEFSMSGRSGTEQVFNTGRRFGVTPPEFKILEYIHKKQFVKIVEEGELAMESDGEDKKGRPIERYRTHDEELDRLRSWYGAKIVEKVYQNENPDLPYTFEEARIPVTLPDNVRAMQGYKKPDAEDAGKGETKKTA